MLDSKEKIVLVFNGEIYNFKELKIELIKVLFSKVILILRFY